MNTLYPPIKEPYNKGYLKVPDGHELYYEQCGNPYGKPILFLHGGPGAGCSSKDRQYFDPQKWQINIFDQRGSGRSHPFGSTENNTIQDLVADIHKLIGFLGINKVALFGGSWGSTLALAYAIDHPKTVSGMILRGIFLGEKDESDYFFNGSTALFFPEAWERFISFVPDSWYYKSRPAEFYSEQLKSENAEVRKKFAYEWARYEEALCHLTPPTDQAADQETTDFPFESLALVEMHYLHDNNCFLPDKYIIEHADQIPDVPISIIQGRYDIVCPPISAYRLAKALPKADFHLVTAGHSSSDPEILEKLISETNALYDKINPAI